ncbi:MFS transporter [Glacieibacterium frigidum]|uniref:MFS transporter n=1 Tax=Glacieibacterium frigidum TaxID=2593303 RepID=A0A552UGG9_9SPHN|nr:MFS transporter [Glacieibacterium frigidum]TRW17322.1 MFS transporter [Glacieibacterium frigidum]
MAAASLHRGRLFWLSVLALFTAAMSASLRAATASGIKAQWIDPVAAADAGRLIGEALGASFLGFAVTLFITSALLDMIGTKRMLLACGACFIVGTLTILLAGRMANGADIHGVVWLGMLICGIGWGLAESAINPLTAQLYPEDTTHRLNMLHAWWPAGLIVGGLAGYFLADALTWQAILGLTLTPAVLVIVIALGTKFPPPMRAETGVTFGEMMTEVFRRPSFLIWFGAMFLTAASELAPGQWVDVALTHKVGMRGILLLVYVSALMFVLRHFAGKLAHTLSNPGLLWVSSLLAAIGLFMLSRADSPVTAMLAATVWGAGVCVMWPTMLASVAERYPRGGSWMMGLVGSAGALSIYFVLPRLGAIYDAAKIDLAGGADALAGLQGAALAQVESDAAARSFEFVAVLPLILLVVFGVVWLMERRKPAATIGAN